MENKQIVDLVLANEKKHDEEKRILNEENVELKEKVIKLEEEVQSLRGVIVMVYQKGENTKAHLSAICDAAESLRLELIAVKAERKAEQEAHHKVEEQRLQYETRLQQLSEEGKQHDEQRAMMEEERLQLVKVRENLEEGRSKLLTKRKFLVAEKTKIDALGIQLTEELQEMDTKRKKHDEDVILLYSERTVLNEERKKFAETVKRSQRKLQPQKVVDKKQ